LLTDYSKPAIIKTVKGKQPQKGEHKMLFTIAVLREMAHIGLVDITEFEDGTIYVSGTGYGSGEALVTVAEDGTIVGFEV